MKNKLKIALLIILLFAIAIIFILRDNNNISNNKVFLIERVCRSYLVYKENPCKNIDFSDQLDSMIIVLEGFQYYSEIKNEYDNIKIKLFCERDIIYASISKTGIINKVFFTEKPIPIYDLESLKKENLRTKRMLIYNKSNELIINDSLNKIVVDILRTEFENQFGKINMHRFNKYLLMIKIHRLNNRYYLYDKEQGCFINNSSINDAFANFINISQNKVLSNLTTYNIDSIVIPINYPTAEQFK